MPDADQPHCPKCNSTMLGRKAFGRITQVDCWECGLQLYVGPRETIDEAYQRRFAPGD